MSKSDTYPLKTSIGFLIHQVHEVMHTAFLEKLSAYGLSATEWAILNLSSSGVDTPDALAAELRIERAAVLRATDQLLNTGMLRRVAHEEASRYSQFALTDKGRKILPKLVAMSRRVNSHFLADFADEKRDELLSLLSSLAESKPFRRARARHLLTKKGCPNCPVRHIYS